MSALQPGSQRLLTGHIRAAVTKACAHVAPTWPLDQEIAVNPWWEFRYRPFAEVSAELAALAKAHCLMPKSYYRNLWRQQIQEGFLKQAAQQLGVQASVDDLIAYLDTPDCPSYWHNVCGWLDSYGNRRHRMAWQDEVTYQISQFCAEFFQPDGPFQGSEGVSLYREWLALTRQDRGLEILMGESQLRKQFQELPDDYESLIVIASEELVFEPAHLTNYFNALLLDVNGWASWVAYLRWQTYLDGAVQHRCMEELLSIRLGWELALWRHYKCRRKEVFQVLKPDWQRQWSELPQIIQAHYQAQQLSWVWQQAAELAYQANLHEGLLQAQLQAQHWSASVAPVLQAVFCIDVRSEPMRRALEAQNPGIETLGFAGFFGLPLQYRPKGTVLRRPQLPGLLKPTIEVTEAVENDSDLIETRKNKLQNTARYQSLQYASPATFSLVEAAGLTYGYKLLKNTFFPSLQSQPVNDLTPSIEWSLARDGVPLTLAEKTELVAVILRNMGFAKNFADTVLFVGHGSKTCNNPHAAGLNCGACGGQTGEINVRVLASLLNKIEIRDALVEHDIAIPAQCRFIAVLHNTTTDDIECLDTLANDQIQKWLLEASQCVRSERSAKLGIQDDNQPGKLAKSIRRRSSDWSQVRPEWGLANNASFIVAPRSYTRSLNLVGRSFLHDYVWQQDEDFRILELIMTAPMIVTNWINMQYNASVVDNLKYGSGNKVLHNVVGGNIGVFEGNSGDLRIGLPWQSVHNGKQWMHQPLRLSVYLAAPKEAINDIIERHQVVADLVNNDWLYIFQWEFESRNLSQYYRAQWCRVAT